MIKRATLSTPYRRIIFGLSTADVLQSLGLVTGPFAPPNDLLTVAPWSVGNTTSCTANGFLNVAGSVGVALYLLSLSIYFYLKLNRKISDGHFRRKYEAKMHLLIIAFIAIIVITALSTTSFNPLPTGALCHLARFPPGCALYPQVVGECVRGADHTMNLVYLVNVGVIPMCLLGVSVFMILLIRNATYTERMYTLDFDGPTQRRSPTGNFFNCIFCCYFEQDQRQDEGDADYVLRLYRRETIVQASLYIGSFLLTNLLSLLILIFNLAGVYKRPVAFSHIGSFLYPSMGFFNILIYCRPKVQACRFCHPDISWIRTFLLVVKAGGEVPDESIDPHALSIRCCCHPKDEDEPNEANARRVSSEHGEVSSRGEHLSTQVYSFFGVSRVSSED